MHYNTGTGKNNYMLLTYSKLLIDSTRPHTWKGILFRRPQTKLSSIHVFGVQKEKYIPYDRIDGFVQNYYYVLTNMKSSSL